MSDIVQYVTPQVLAPYKGEASRLLRGNEQEAARVLIAATRAFDGVRELAQQNADRYNKQAAIYFPSFVDCVLDMARLGLTPGSDEAYLIPFWDKRANAYSVEMIVGPKGLMRLAYESGRVERIIADTVCEGDSFGYDEDDGTFRRTKGPRAFPNHTARHDAITHVFAQAIIVPRGVDGTRYQKRLVVLSRGDIEYYRGFSRAPDGDLWGKHYDGAAKKTAIKRLCEQLPQRDGNFGLAMQETASGAFARPAAWDSVVPQSMTPKGPRPPALAAAHEITGSDAIEPPRDIAAELRAEIERATTAEQCATLLSRASEIADEGARRAFAKDAAARAEQLRKGGA